jgi:hypothetical protein
MDNQPNNISRSPGCLPVLTAILGLYQIIFALHVLQQADHFPDVGVPVMILVSWSMLWAVGFLGLTVGLVRRNHLALRYSGWFVIVFLIMGLLRSVIFAQADYNRNRLPFLALMTLVILAVPLLVLLRKE